MGTEHVFEQCGITSTTFASCEDGDCDNEERIHPVIQCLPGIFLPQNKQDHYELFSANCNNGTIRLVGGSTDREGRVEVCVGGRWGTVQNNNSQLIEFVCSTLGFPTEGRENDGCHVCLIIML